MIVDMSPGHRIPPSKAGATWQVTSPKAQFQKKRRLRGCVCRSSGLRPSSRQTHPRHSHLDCRAVLTLIVAQHSGASRTGRTELETIMQFLRADDELVVLRLDRPGRSPPDVLNLVHELDQRGASLRVLVPEVTLNSEEHTF